MPACLRAWMSECLDEWLLRAPTICDYSLRKKGVHERTMALAPRSLHKIHAFSGIDETLSLTYPNAIMTNCWSLHKPS
jgi:hypothetical protein